MAATKTQIAPERNGRTAGRTGRSIRIAPGRGQRDRHEVVRGAEQPAQAFDGLRAGAPAVPAEVDEEGEEQGEADEAQPEQVELALFERGQVELRTPERRARRAAGLRAAGFFLAGIWRGPLRRAERQALLAAVVTKDVLKVRAIPPSAP